MSVNIWMDKEVVVYIYNGILLSHKKEHIWVRSSDIIQSEVSQKEKNKYYTLTHIYGIWKHGIDEPISRAAMETQT